MQLAGVEAILEIHGRELSEIKAELKELSRQMTLNNAHLAEHMRRTAILEEQMSPLNSLVKAATLLIPLIAAIYYGLKVLGKL